MFDCWAQVFGIKLAIKFLLHVNATVELSEYDVIPKFCVVLFMISREFNAFLSDFLCYEVSNSPIKTLALDGSANCLIAYGFPAYHVLY